MDKRLAPTKFCVETLLPQGLCILAGAPKIGKSWLVLDLCVKVAKGEPFLGQPTIRGTVLYLCLEDSLRRIQERLCNIADEVPANVFFATQAGTMESGLEDQIRSFSGAYPDLSLVVIDTFQLIRGTSCDVSYASDYEEVRGVKFLADSLGITILLVHHLRKMGDSDPLNKISGSTGIAGAADAAYILDKSRRNADTATLCCTGRDIPDREIELKLGKEIHTWEVVQDSLETQDMLLPETIVKVIEFIMKVRSYSGSNAEFTERFCEFANVIISSKALKQQMNRYRYKMEEKQIFFRSYRSSGQRMIDIHYCPADEINGTERDANDASDARNTVPV